VSDRPGFLSNWQRLFALLYLLAAGFAAWQTVGHTNAEADYFDQICGRKSIGNEGAQVIGHHGFIGSIFASQMNLGLPSMKKSTQSLAEIPHLERLDNQEGILAHRWSWILFGLSLLYLMIAAVRPGPERVRNVLFALTCISTIAFSVGMSASAMKIFSIIHNFFGTTPVVQHEVRSIYSVIVALFSSGHWIFAGFLTLFSVVTPSIKIALTFSATLTSSESTNSKISKFLGEIGKWSMADVFVGAVLLSFFVIQSGQATQVVPCRGLYYFAAYCLLSMVTTELLRIVNFQKAPPSDSKAWLSVPTVGGLVGVALFLSAILSLKK
jgi:Paraquat-inducible protein A